LFYITPAIKNPIAKTRLITTAKTAIIRVALA
jgi:hypothetical protein